MTCAARSTSSPNRSPSALLRGPCLRRRRPSTRADRFGELRIEGLALDRDAFTPSLASTASNPRSVCFEAAAQPSLPALDCSARSRLSSTGKKSLEQHSPARRDLDRARARRASCSFRNRRWRGETCCSSRRLWLWPQRAARRAAPAALFVDDRLAGFGLEDRLIVVHCRVQARYLLL